jgi:hypothetical protein
MPKKCLPAHEVGSHYSTRIALNRDFLTQAQNWYNYNMDRLAPMDRKRTALIQMSSASEHDHFVPGTPAERISLVWPLTLEVVSMSKRYDAERRLQRHVTRIVSREG